eukprot:160758_1
MADALNDWIILSKPPFNKHQHTVSCIFNLNEQELLIIICDNQNSLWQFIGIWIYNICNGNYTKLMDEANINEIIRYYTASLNDNKSVLYLFGESGKIIKVNLKTKQFEVS